MGACFDKAASSKNYRYKAKPRTKNIENGKQNQDCESPKRNHAVPPASKETLTVSITKSPQKPQDRQYRTHPPPLSPRKIDQNSNQRNKLDRQNVDESPKKEQISIEEQSEPANEGHITLPYTNRMPYNQVNTVLFDCNSTDIDCYLAGQAEMLSNEISGKKHIFKRPNLKRLPIVRAKFP